MAKLVVIEGPDAGNEHDLDVAAAKGRASLIAGRDPRNELPVNDTAVSRRHFSLEWSPRGWRLVDQGSRNQTFLNGRPVKEALLVAGDVIRAGDTEFRYENQGEALNVVGVQSTILKELPVGRRHDTILERIQSLEAAVQTAGAQPPEPRVAAHEAVVRVSKLFEACGQLTATISATDLFARLVEEALPVLEADGCTVVLREAGRWVLKASQSSPDSPGGVNVSESILERVAQEKRATLTASTRKENGSTASAESLSVIAAPLVSSGETRAVLYAERRATHRPFTEADLELLAAIAEPVGSLFAKFEAAENLRQENRNLYRSITETKRIVGRSRATEELLEFIRRASPTPMTVLIQGETGTGKELVAAAIHYASPRRGRPFVAINCAALPENLVESELFGHERGAFTGAATRRKGRFELADSGTVFLDEVGELTLACQAKLLRLLEERQFERVGGVESVKIDVRIIAATNRDLLAAVNEGAFREDLYYRLSVLNVQIPPLRQRPEDVPLLAQHFLDALGGTSKLSKATLKKLGEYSWPGNVRQLRNVIESAVVLGKGPEISPEDLILPPPKRLDGPREKEAWEPITLESLERFHIERVLGHTSGNKKRAAELLGIERCTLYAKLKSYDLGSPKGELDE